MILYCNYNKPKIPSNIQFYKIYFIIPNYNNSHNNFFIFNKILFKNNLNILSNLKISSILFNNLIIQNNCLINSNINTTNIKNLYNGYLHINDYFNIDNTILKIRNNICSNNSFILKLIKYNPTSIFKVSNNINIFNNFNLDTIHIKNNINSYKNIIVNNTTISSNLTAFKNVNINLFTSSQILKLKHNLNVNNLYVKNNTNINGNYNTNFITLNKDLIINNKLNIINGVFNIQNTLINIYYDSSIYPYIHRGNEFILGRANNREVILNDFYSYKFKNNINLHDNHYIDFIYDHKYKLQLTHYNLNITPHMYIYGNNIIKYNITIFNNSTFNNKFNIYNNCFVNKGTLQLPSNTTSKFIGAITYNTHTNEINILNNNNNWDYLQFIDKNNTGIIRKNHQFTFKIFNNIIFTYNNNAFINRYTFFNNKTFHINATLNIYDTFYTNNIIFINNIPIQFYNNLLRSYNHYNNKWTSLTLEYLSCFYKTPYKSYNFYLHHISNHFKTLNTYNYFQPTNILFKSYSTFETEYIHTTTFITHLFFNIISYNSNNYLYYINIYKNNIIIHQIIIKNSFNIIKLNKTLIFKKNDLLQIKVKSNYTHKQSILIYLFGYYKDYINNLIGDSNFLTDTEIFFNNNTTFNKNVYFNNNVNIHDSLFIHNNNSNKSHIQINKLSICKNIYKDTLFEIDNKFFITQNGSIGFGKFPTKALIDIKCKEKQSFINYGGMSFLSNANILQNAILNNINIYNNINTTNIHTDKLLYKSISNINNISSNNINILNNITLNNNSNILINNLKLSKYNNNISIPNNSCYLSLSTNNNLLFKYNISNNINTFILPKNIDYYQNNIILNKFIKIQNNSISILSNINNNNIITISSIFNINKSGTININNDLIFNNLNISNKIKSLLYDIYGPKNINLHYDFKHNDYYSNILLFNNSNTITIFFDISYIKIIQINNIIYHKLSKQPYYKFYDFNSYIDLLYFTDIVLINNNIKNFRNNIKSYKIYNPYNYSNITIKYNSFGNIIYPYYTFIINQTIYHNYGLKTQII